MIVAAGLIPLVGLAPPLQQGAAIPGTVSVRACGAIGDARTDDTAAFQAAIDQAASMGGTVFVDPVTPGGGYVLSRTVVLHSGVSLVGSLAGMPFIAWEGVPRNRQTGPTILARPKAEEYAPGNRPLCSTSWEATRFAAYISSMTSNRGPRIKNLRILTRPTTTIISRS
ncbi:MAG: glycosyl hydrolase family 28-related protein [Candidatus Zipacnadales bacterium]